MECETITDRAALADLRVDWDALWTASLAPTLPLRWSWFDAWWSSFGRELGSSARLHVLVFRRNGVLRAIVPCFLRRTRFRGIPVEELGSLENAYSPLWDAVVASDLTDQEIEAVGRGLLGTPDIDLIALRRVDERSLLRRWVVEHAPEGVAWGDRDSVQVPIVDTTVAWEAYFGARERKYRNKLKKKLRDFERREGATVTDVAVRSGNDEALEEIIEVSSRSWKRGIGADLASRPTEREFLRRLLDHLGPAGDARVWLARLDGRPIASELHVKAHGITYPIRADIDESARDLSPGSVVEHHALRAAFEDPAIRSYDTCATNYWYLRKLTDDRRMTYQMEVFPRRPKALLLHSLEYRAIPVMRQVPALKRLKRWIKKADGPR